MVGGFSGDMGSFQFHDGLGLGDVAGPALVQHPVWLV